MANEEIESQLLDDAARAGWLYYVGGRTQDEIAKTLGVSRQRAQRLVARAVSDGLVRVHIEHPITDLMDLAARLRDQLGLERARVAPDLGVEGNLRSIAPFAARTLEGVLANPNPQIIGFGTGRSLRAMIEQLGAQPYGHHRLVSLIGNIAPDGTATVYDILLRIADLVGAPHFPLPTPVLAQDPAERAIYQSLYAVQRVYKIAEATHAAFVGVGQMDETAPAMIDGFMAPAERDELLSKGAVGEICGRPYDRDGQYIASAYTDRMMSYQIQSTPTRMVFGIGGGRSKVAAIRGAIRGRIINALVTDEVTARALLQVG